MTPVLDDLDSRPGSVTSLLRSIVGLYLRAVGGWMSAADLTELMQQLGVAPARTRTAIVRLKSKGLLSPRSRAATSGYELGAGAAAMLERGDRRIFTPTQMTSTDPWCLVSFSLPEDLRHLRHQLRRRLYWIGAGTVSDGLWICPDSLAAEVEGIVSDLGIGGHVTLFRTDQPRVEGALSDAIARWWDLLALASAHRQFLAAVGAFADAAAVEPSTAFARYIRLIDSWRVIPYIDPGLPVELLPEGWPGVNSVVLFHRLSERYAADSLRFVHALVRRPRAR